MQMTTIQPKTVQKLLNRIFKIKGSEPSIESVSLLNLDTICPI